MAIKIDGGDPLTSINIDGQNVERVLFELENGFLQTVFGQPDSIEFVNIGTQFFDVPNGVTSITYCIYGAGGGGGGGNGSDNPAGLDEGEGGTGGNGGNGGELKQGILALDGSGTQSLEIFVGDGGIGGAGGVNNCTTCAVAGLAGGDSYVRIDDASSPFIVGEGGVGGSKGTSWGSIKFTDPNEVQATDNAIGGQGAFGQPARDGEVGRGDTPTCAALGLGGSGGVVASQTAGPGGGGAGGFEAGGDGGDGNVIGAVGGVSAGGGGGGGGAGADLGDNGNVGKAGGKGGAGRVVLSWII